MGMDDRFGTAAIGLLLWAALAAGGCARNEKDKVQGRKLVIASIYPLAAIVQELGGDQVKAKPLIPPGLSAHGYEPTVSDFASLHEADLIVSVGMGYDDWMLAHAERENRVTMADKPAAAAGKKEGAARHGHEDHEDEPPNSHLWLDPVLMHEFVEKKLGPRMSAMLGRPVATEPVLKRLRALDEEFRRRLAPHAGKKFITYHNAFDVVANRYKLGEVITITPLDSPTTVTPAKVKEAIEALEKHGVRAVFVEQQFPVDIGRMLQRKAGVTIRVLDTQGDPNDPNRDSYFKFMLYNLRELEEGLSESTGK